MKEGVLERLTRTEEEDNVTAQRLIRGPSTIKKGVVLRIKKDGKPITSQFDVSWKDSGTGRSTIEFGRGELLDRTGI